MLNRRGNLKALALASSLVAEHHQRHWPSDSQIGGCWLARPTHGCVVVRAVLRLCTRVGRRLHGDGARRGDCQRARPRNAGQGHSPVGGDLNAPNSGWRAGQGPQRVTPSGPYLLEQVHGGFNQG